MRSGGGDDDDVRSDENGDAGKQIENGSERKTKREIDLFLFFCCCDGGDGGGGAGEGLSLGRGSDFESGSASVVDDGAVKIRDRVRDRRHDYNGDEKAPCCKCFLIFF